jgi:hypothetical protein
VIADMFGMALRTYQTKLQRLSESRTDRGRSLWEALFAFVQEKGRERPVGRGELLQRFRHDDALVVGGVLRDLVDSGLLYRSGRGDLAHYGVVQTPFDAASPSADERAELFVWMCVHRLAPCSAQQVSEALSMEPTLVERSLARLVADGRVRAGGSKPPRFESDACVIPLGSPVGWEVALFDHYQAMVMAICSKLESGRRSATASDLVGGSTFSFRVWPEHPYYQEATSFLARFRSDGSALRKKIATYNEAHEPPAEDEHRVVIYAGQTLLGVESEQEDSE